MTEFFKTAKQAFDYADKNNYDLIISRKNIKGTFDFSAIKSDTYLNFMSYIEKYDQGIDRFSTIIRENQNDRMRLDIEIYVKSKKNSQLCDELIRELLKDIQEHSKLDLKEIIESDNSRKANKKGFSYKYSKHLFFNYYFESTEHQKTFWDDFLKSYPEWINISTDEIYFDFDRSVYYKNSQWNESKRFSEYNLKERCPTIIDKTTLKKIIVDIIKEEKKRPVEKKEKAVESNNIEVKNDMKIPKEQKNEIIELCNMLSYERINNYSTWRDLIFCLSNISYSKDMEKIAIQISQKSDKANDKDFNKEFKNIWDGKTSERKLTIGSLYYWAKQDNNEKYNTFIMNKLKEFKGECLLMDDDYTESEMDKIINNDNSHMGIAKLILRMISRKVKFISKSLVYSVNKYNVWEKGSESSLMKIISYDVIYRLTKYYYENIDNLEKEDKVSSIFLKIHMIKDGKEITNILKFLQPVLVDITFLDKLDSNLDILAFNNKLVDLKTKEVRPIKIDDHISITTGYDYPEEEMKYEDEIYKYFEKIYPDQQKREFILNEFSQYLSGRIGSHRVLIHAGKNNSGGNGKTSTFAFLKKVMGKYSYSIPADIFCGKQNPNPQSPRPDIIHLKGKRLIYTSEPDEGEKLNARWIKLLSGGDPVSARLCNSNEIVEFEPTLHNNFLCNQLLAFNGSDGGMGRRLKVIEYKSRFVSDQKLVDETKHIYLCDENIDNKFKLWRNDFIRILINKYDINYKFLVPDIVEKSSKKYFEQNNATFQFKEKYIVPGNGYITLTDIKNIWKSDDELEPIKQRDLIAGLKTLYPENYFDRKKISGKDYRNVIIGYVIKEDEE